MKGRVKNPFALLAGSLFLVLAVVITLAALLQDADFPLYLLAALNAAAGVLLLLRAFRAPPGALRRGG